MIENLCPGCGSATKPDSPEWVGFECGSIVALDMNLKFQRSTRCYEAELAQLRTALAECQAREVESLKLLSLAVPKICSCHCDFERVIPLPENEHWREKAWRLNREMCREFKPEMKRIFSGKCVKHSIDRFLANSLSPTSVLIPQAELVALREVANMAKYGSPGSLKEALSKLDGVREVG